MQCETCEQRQKVHPLQLPSGVVVKEEEKEEEKEEGEEGEIDKQGSGEMKDDDEEKSAISRVCTNFLKQVHVFVYVEHTCLDINININIKYKYKYKQNTYVRMYVATQISCILHSSICLYAHTYFLQVLFFLTDMERFHPDAKQPRCLYMCIEAHMWAHAKGQVLAHYETG